MKANPLPYLETDHRKHEAETILGRLIQTEVLPDWKGGKASAVLLGTILTNCDGVRFLFTWQGFPNHEVSWTVPQTKQSLLFSRF